MAQVRKEEEKLFNDQSSSSFCGLSAAGIIWLQTQSCATACAGISLALAVPGAAVLRRRKKGILVVSVSHFFFFLFLPFFFCSPFP